jgi:hypothetical protein
LCPKLLDHRKFSQHPIAEKLGVNVSLIADTDLYFYPDPDRPTSWECARLSLFSGDILEFSIKDQSRVLSASFDSSGHVLALSCSSGLPNGDTAAVTEMFCEEGRHAFQELVMHH